MRNCPKSASLLCKTLIPLSCNSHIKPIICRYQSSLKKLSLYEKIRSTSDGLAAVRLADGKCQGCHLTMSAAELTRINSLAIDELVRCEECRRILIRIT
ncbi:MAG: hypothetical protein EBX34_05355 [Actinobacteria bacterium]|nr:hypothetical protein [Actinomycetota bacterium]